MGIKYLKMNFKNKNSDYKNGIVELIESAGCMAIVFLAGIYSLSLTEIFFKIHISEYNVLFVFLIIIIFIYKFSSKYKNLWFSFFIFIVVFLISILISISVVDTSYDGMRYHAAGVVAVKDGWDFFTQPAPQSELGKPYAKWLAIYPKALWVIGCNFYQATGFFEASKAVNWIGFFISFAFAFKLGFQLGLKEKQSYLLSALVSFNPITTAQILTFQQDGFMASLILTAICILIGSFYSPSRLQGIMLALLLVIIINIKTTGVVFMVILLGGFIAWKVYMKQCIKYISYPIFGLFLGFCVAGYSPFTNAFLKTGNPFYGVVGNGAVPFEQLNQDLLHKNRFILFFASVFGRSERVPNEINLKVPGSVNAREVREIADSSRFSGFGPLFSLALVLSLAGSILYFGMKCKGSAALAFILSVLLFATIVHPAAWWARYVPHFYLIPIVFIVYSWLVVGRNVYGRALSIITIIVLLVNISLFSYHLTRCVILSERIKSEISSIKHIHQSYGYVSIVENQCWNVKGPLLLAKIIPVKAAADINMNKGVKILQIAGITFLLGN